MPWEQARRTFRNELKLIEKELGQLLAGSTELPLQNSKLCDTERASKFATRLEQIMAKVFSFYNIQIFYNYSSLFIVGTGSK